MFILFTDRKCGVELDLLSLAHRVQVEKLCYLNEDGTTEDCIQSMEGVIDELKKLPAGVEISVVDLNTDTIYTVRNPVPASLPTNGRYFVEPFYNTKI